MIFADREFYETKYLMGRPPVIPLEQAEFWLTEATSAINFKNIPDTELKFLFATISDSTMDKLKRATCRIAEILYAAEQAGGLPDNNVIRSETVGTYSVSYLEQESDRDKINKAIRNEVVQRLNNTALHNAFIFRG